MSENTNQFVLSLDYGSKRIGVAIASTLTKLPKPLTTLANDNNFSSELEKIIEQENISHLVIGYPRNLNGEITKQTKLVDQFVNELKHKINLPIDLQDEALTSIKAEENLKANAKAYDPADIDSLAAAIILEDWLSYHQQEMR